MPSKSKRCAAKPDSVQDAGGEGKQFFCQRCLNHGFTFSRKGHKPHCRFMSCSCAACSMVEDRRQLNNAIARQTPAAHGQIVDGRRVRNPTCARCNSHGLAKPLRGHKKTKCPFDVCRCDPCLLITKRRQVMAAQIKLRRHQRRLRENAPLRAASTTSSLVSSDDDDSNSSTSRETSMSIPAPSPSEVIVPQPVYPVPVLQPITIPRMTASLDLALAAVLNSSHLVPPPLVSPQISYDQVQLLLAAFQQNLLQ